MAAFKESGAIDSFPRKWECSLFTHSRAKNRRLFSYASGIFPMQKRHRNKRCLFVTHFMTARAVQSTLYLTYRLPVEPPIDFEYRKEKTYE